MAEYANICCCICVEGHAYWYSCIFHSLCCRAFSSITHNHTENVSKARPLCTMAWRSREKIFAKHLCVVNIKRISMSFMNMDDS